MSGKRKVILTLSAAVLAAAVLLTALFFFVLRPRMDERVFMDERPLSRQELLAYTSPYDQAVDPLCKPYLEDEHRLLYAAFLYAYEQRASTIRLLMEEAYSKEAVFEILSMLKADYPQFMTTTLESQFTLEQDEKGWLTVGIPAAELAYIPDETALAAAESLLAEIPGVPAGQLSSAAARAYSIYTYLTANISYQAEGEADGIGWNFTVQGAIRDGKAQCNGIAGAFQLLCNLEDIPCYKVFYRGRDVGRDYGHVWNVARRPMVSCGHHRRRPVQADAGSLFRGRRDVPRNSHPRLFRYVGRGGAVRNAPVYRRAGRQGPRMSRAFRNTGQPVWLPGPSRRGRRLSVGRGQGRRRPGGKKGRRVSRRLHPVRRCGRTLRLPTESVYR